MKVTAVVVVGLVVAGCGSTTTENTLVPTTTEFVVTTTSTTVPLTTTVPPTTTTTEPTYDFVYEVWIYDSFEPMNGLVAGSGCFGIDTRISIKSDARIVIRNETDDSVTASANLPDGEVEYDETGPPEGEAGADLFYRCVFEVEFMDILLDPSGNYRVELPGGVNTDIIATEDFVRGIATGLLLQNFETERQRLRSEQQ